MLRKILKEALNFQLPTVVLSLKIVTLHFKVVTVYFIIFTVRFKMHLTLFEDIFHLEAPLIMFSHEKAFVIERYCIFNVKCYHIMLHRWHRRRTRLPVTQRFLNEFN